MHPNTIPTELDREEIYYAFHPEGRKAVGAWNPVMRGGEIIMNDTTLTTFETTDEMLVREMEREAIYRGMLPQWGSKPEQKLFWIEINCDQKEMRAIERAAAKLVKRDREIAQAKSAMMETGR